MISVGSVRFLRELCHHADVIFSVKKEVVWRAKKRGHPSGCGALSWCMVCRISRDYLLASITKLMLMVSTASSSESYTAFTAAASVVSI